MTYGIFHDLIIGVGREKLFNAITTPIGLNSWWTLEAAGQPKVGEEYQLYFGPEYDWRAKLVRCVPHELIYFEMGKSDNDWEGTQFRFTLSPNPLGTLVRFEHVGWESNNDHFRRTSYCWAIYLKGLKKYLEEGVVMPFGERGAV